MDALGSILEIGLSLFLGFVCSIVGVPLVMLIITAVYPKAGQPGPAGTFFNMFFKVSLVVCTIALTLVFCNLFEW